MSNIVVKLFTRPTIRGNRKWVEVNPKLFRSLLYQ
jgi:hypothetical protein